MKLYLDTDRTVTSGPPRFQRFSIWDDGDMFADNYRKFTPNKVNAAEGQACTHRVEVYPCE